MLTVTSTNKHLWRINILTNIVRNLQQKQSQLTLLQNKQLHIA